MVRARNLIPGIGPKGPARQGRLLVSSSPQPTVPAIAPCQPVFLAPILRARPAFPQLQGEKFQVQKSGELEGGVGVYAVPPGSEPWL